MVLWRLIHHCLAHPLLGLAEITNAQAQRFHDWTGERSYPDEPRPGVGSVSNTVSRSRLKNNGTVLDGTGGADAEDGGTGGPVRVLGDPHTEKPSLEGMLKEFWKVLHLFPNALKDEQERQKYRAAWAAKCLELGWTIEEYEDALIREAFKPS